MINSNVAKAAGEVFEAHGIVIEPGEHMATTVSRALNVNEPEAELWLAALDAGATVEEANLRAGVKGDDPILTAMAKALGRFAGTIADTIAG